LTPAQLAKARRFAGNWKPKRQNKGTMHRKFLVKESTMKGSRITEHMTGVADP
jgi:hypothetical protein